MTSNKNTDKNIELRSEGVKEILGIIPNWIIRSGSGMIFLICIILIIGSCFFKYPDIIKSRMILTTINPPAEIIARANGKLSEIRVNNNSIIDKDKIIAIIANPANIDDIFKLKKDLTILENELIFSENFNFKFDKIDNLKLGEIQEYYNSLYAAYLDLNRFNDIKYYKRKAKALQNKKNNYLKYLNKEKQKQLILLRELTINQNQFQRDSSLFVKNVIAKEQLQKTEKSYLQQQININENKSKISLIEIDISSIEENIIELELKKQEELGKLKNQILNKFKSLNAEISIWENKYLMISPIKGRLIYNNIWSINQNVNNNQKIFTVIPLDSTKIIAKLNMGLKGAGKVKPGQQVNLKLDNYPYMEYGILRGTVKTISKVPENKSYNVDVILNNGLTTSYNIKLKFGQHIEGKAEIITEDLKLIHRLLNPLRALIKNSLN